MPKDRLLAEDLWPGSAKVGAYILNELILWQYECRDNPSKRCVKCQRFPELSVSDKSFRVIDVFIAVPPTVERD